MPNPFICLNNFNHHHHHHHHHHQEEEENNGLNQKRSNLCRRRAQGSSANRYSKRGLDKFTALLARLHEKRRRIYSEKMGCNLKNRNADMKKLNQEQKCRQSEMPQIKTGVSERSKNVNKWRRPGCYLPVIMILVLLFLVLLGRSTAIMSTCVGWYVLPTLKGEGSAVRCKNNIESTLQPWRWSSADKDEIM